MRVINLLFIVFCSLPTFAQQMIQGTVVDAEKGGVLPDVQITVRQGTLVSQYTYSDKNGNFKIKKPTDANGSLLFFSLMGYKSTEVKIADTSDKMQIKLYPHSFSIKEVTVTAPKIRGQGDTIMYYVEQFAAERDKTIGDVLKKMPGIDIDTEGKVTYNGKSINKFYIEGQDLLGGRYGVAVNGIPQQEVGSVEVYEDHQPIKALEGLSFSDQAAINVKLKESAKAHWIATLEGGSGLPLPLWEAKLFAMCIKKDEQNISVLKSNNNGHDLSRECETVTTRGVLEEENSYNQGQYIDVALPRVPFLSSERTLDNRSYLFSTNQLWGLKNDYQLKGQINYLNDETKSKAASETVYYLPEEDYTLAEIEDGKLRKNMLATNLTIIGNKKSFYLNNALNTEWQWSKTDLATLNSQDRIRQKTDLPSYKISNSFSLVKRTGQHSISLSSFTLLQSDPHDLDIHKNEDIRLHQSVTTGLLFNNNYASYSFSLKKFVVSMTGGINLLLHRLESDQYGDILLSDVPTTNEVKANYIRAYLTPKVELNKKTLIMTLQCPINYYHYLYKAGTENHTMNYYFYSPTLRVQYNITPDLKWSVWGGFSQQKPDVLSWYNGVIMQDYRNARQGYITDKEGSNKTINTNISYKNLTLILFANVSVLMQWNDKKYIESRNFKDNGVIVYSFTPQDYQSAQQIISAKVSKGVSWINGALSLQSTYYAQHSKMNQNEVLIPYTIKTFVLSGNMNGKIGSMMDWNYNISYSKNSLNTKDDELFSNKTLLNKIGTDWHFGKKITLRASAEHYNNEISENKYKNTFFLDASIVYKINSKHEISLDATNLLNKNMYNYTLTNSLSTYISRQSIRERNIFIRFFCQL